MKKLLTIQIFIFMTLAMFAMGDKDTDGKTVKVVVPNGAPTMCIAKMITEKPNLGLNTEYESVKSPKLMQARLLSGEADIVIAPSNLAAILYAKKTDIQIAGTVVWGILYGATTENIQSIQDLKGKTILTFGRGLTPDITVREIFSKMGLQPDKDVFFKYVESTPELAPMFISGKATTVILPEPMLSMVLTKKPNAKVFLDVQKEWKKTIGGNSSYPQASLIISKKLIKENPKYVKKFIKSVEKSMNWAVSNPEKAAKMGYDIMGGIPTPILTKGIPRMNLEWKSAKEAQPALESYFSILFSKNPKFIGGKMPDDGLYYKGK
ncbi:MAG: hypothetical protein CR988_08065 [Treponema sp.]|nr:MAG: hypothetical protein CR988_08065 [Treponema sp.]